MPFIINDRVDKTDASRTNGTVSGKGCFATTKAGGQTCARNTCTHQPQDYITVDWPAQNGQAAKTTTLHENELQLSVSSATPTQPSLPTDQQDKQMVADDPLADNDLKQVAKDAGEIIQDRLKMGQDPAKIKDFFKNYNYKMPARKDSLFDGGEDLDA